MSEQVPMDSPYLQDLVDSLPHFVLVFDRSGCVVDANRPALDYLERDLEGLRNLRANDPIWRKSHPADLAIAEEERRRCREDRLAFDSERRIMTEDESYRCHLFRYKPLHDDRGQVRRWICTATDLEDMKRADELRRKREHALHDEASHIIKWFGSNTGIEDRERTRVALKSEQSLRADETRLFRANEIATLAELSGLIAYEIYQPLGAVVLHGDACQNWLSMDPPNLERALLGAQRIVRDAKAAAEVIQRLRALFNQALPKKALLSLNEVLSEVLHLSGGDLQRKSVVLESRLAPDLPVVCADKVQMQLLFTNLLQNAIDSMDSVEDRPRTLTIESMTDENMFVVISIRDSGSGVQSAERLYEPFLTTKATEMGMGLAISRSVVEAHGGSLQEKPNPFNGTIFTVNLPVGRDTPSGPVD
jgi:C4-dicarboxylate-specific signal transduction histidine kinase